METPSANPQQILDNEHLKLLSIFLYIMGGFSALFGCIPIIHIVLGLFFILSPHSFGEGPNRPPHFSVGCS
jgi:hypothetical protein